MLNSDQLRERLLKSGLCTPATLIGCHESDLLRIEDHIGHRLPTAYKDVMRVLGRGAGDFESDVDMFYPSVVTMTDGIREELEECEQELPKDAFVFAQRLGTQFLFFSLNNGPAPPIFRCEDDDPNASPKVCDSIWEFIRIELEGHEQLRNRKR